jgi:hypothetical protein
MTTPLTEPKFQLPRDARLPPTSNEVMSNLPTPEGVGFVAANGDQMGLSLQDQEVNPFLGLLKGLGAEKPILI